MNFQGIIVEKNTHPESAILLVSEDCDDTNDNNKPYSAGPSTYSIAD